MRLLLALLLCWLALPALPESAPQDPDAGFLASAPAAIAHATRLLDQDDARGAARFLTKAREQFADDADLATLAADALVRDERFGEAEALLALPLLETADTSTLRTSIETYYDRSTRSDRLVVIVLQKKLEAGDYATVISLADRAIAKFPNKDVLHALKGEAQYKANQLDEAEVTLREALQINPFNQVAKEYIETIRTTREAQTSTTLAEWLAIAKDKVGDLIVTFLALFAALLMNSTIAPIVLRLKLRSARRAFENGDYDEFTDLIEGLLDEENFAPLRSNFRFLLERKSYEEAREILNTYVNTLDRLPTLLRILEREHEKLATS